jgi:hypothetical protein
VPLVHIPRVMLNDQQLSLLAKGLAGCALAFGGAFDVAQAARLERTTEDVEAILDAVDQLVSRRYATVIGDELVLTPISGWGA